jgi:hypothetical protein
MKKPGIIYQEGRKAGKIYRSYVGTMKITETRKPFSIIPANKYWIPVN